MKINTEGMRAYANLDDRALWAELLKLAESHGYKLKADMPPKELLDRIRRVMRGEEQISLGEGMKILREYKDRGKK
ncbi:MAG: hypothetical protein IJD51_06275 [Clostridia bacterium]|nr:hypothetical protein [Clostridia bacterium]